MSHESQPEDRSASKQGFVHLYTGDGKGKTTCAVGLAVRAAGAGVRVAFCQFDKGFEGKNEHYHERAVLRSLPSVELFFFGLERMMPTGKFRFANEPGDLEQAHAGLAKARELIARAEYGLIILDEAITCIGTKLYSEDDLMAVIGDFRDAKRDADSEVHDLVLTGRGASERLIEAADLVTEMALKKHYFYQNVPARKGIEF